jgi:hypothetical protein
MYDPLSLRPHPLTRLLLAPLALFGLTACGITFSSGFDGTEMFKAIELTGDRHPGAELTVILGIELTYPVPVEIACFYEDEDNVTEDMQKLPFHERARPAGSTVLEPVRDTTPGADVERQELSFRFRAPEPGDYFIACLTPAAPENGIGVDFKVSPP